VRGIVQPVRPQGGQLQSVRRRGQPLRGGQSVRGGQPLRRGQSVRRQEPLQPLRG